MERKNNNRKKKRIIDLSVLSEMRMDIKCDKECAKTFFAKILLGQLLVDRQTETQTDS